MAVCYHTLNKELIQMLDLKFIRANPEKVKEGLAKRGEDIDIDRLLELDGKRRDLLSEA